MPQLGALQSRPRAPPAPPRQARRALPPPDACASRTSSASTALAVQRLDRRLVAIYKQSDPTTIDVVLAAKSFQDVLDQLDYLGAIASRTSTSPPRSQTAKQQVAGCAREDAHGRAATASRARRARSARRAQQEAILRGAAARRARHQLAGRALRRSRTRSRRRRRRSSRRSGESQALAVASAALARPRLRRGALVERRRSTDTTSTAHGAPAGRAELHLAGERPDHEPVRHALGHAASGDRHRRPDGHADPRRRRRQGHLLRLDVRLRQPRDDRPRRRPTRPPTATSRASRSPAARTSRRAR